MSRSEDSAGRRRPARCCLLLKGVVVPVAALALAVLGSCGNRAVAGAAEDARAGEALSCWQYFLEVQLPGRD
jgi:hypothetical protein